MRHVFKGKGDCKYCAGGRDRPSGRRVQALPPNHDPADFPAVKVGHRGDVALVSRRIIVESLQNISIFTKLRHLMSLAQNNP